MPDKDIYGKVLGDGFLKVRAAICNSGDDVGAQAIANYLDIQMRKDIHVEDLVAEITPALGNQGSLFPTDGLIARLDRLADSLAGEHFSAAARFARDTGGSVDNLLSDLVHRAIQSTRCRLELQTDYRDDLSAQRAYARLEDHVKRVLLARLKTRCGLGPEMKRTSLIVKDQRDLLQFEVAFE